jgi:hypothetical protein
LPRFTDRTHNAEVNVSQLATKRKQIGLLALACLGLALCLWFFARDPEHNVLLAGVTRVGIVLGALWLALPKNGATWMWQKAGPVLIVAVALIALAGRALRYTIPIAILLAIILVLLRPRRGRGS